MSRHLRERHRTLREAEVFLQDVPRAGTFRVAVKGFAMFELVDGSWTFRSDLVREVARVRPRAKGVRHSSLTAPVRSTGKEEATPL